MKPSFNSRISLTGLRTRTLAELSWAILCASFAVVPLAVGVHDACAQESAEVAPPEPKYGMIQGLKLNVGSASIKMYAKDGKPIPVATVTGTFARARGNPPATLSAQGRAVQVQANGSFQAMVVLTGDSTWLPLIASSRGKTEKAFALIRYPGFARLRAGMSAQGQKPQAQSYQVKDDEGMSTPSRRKKWYLTPAVGYESISHAEPTALISRSLGLLSAKLKLAVDFTPHVFAVLEGGLTPLTLSSNAVGVSTMFLGGSGLVGAQFGKSTFKAGLGVGYGFDTMVVSDLTFGYQNLSAIQIAPHIDVTLSKAVSALVRFRYGIILGLPAIANSIVAVEGDFSYFLKNGHPVVLRGNWHTTNFTTGTAVVNQSGFFAGLGYGI